MDVLPQRFAVGVVVQGMLDEILRTVPVAINELIGVQDTAVSEMVIDEEGKFWHGGNGIARAGGWGGWIGVVVAGAGDGCWKSGKG